MLIHIYFHCIVFMHKLNNSYNENYLKSCTYFHNKTTYINIYKHI